MQTDNHNFRENITTNEKYILRKMGLNFHKKHFTCILLQNLNAFGYKKPWGTNETSLEQVIVAE